MPDWKLHIRQRLAAMQLTPTRETAIVEELSQDLDDCYADLLARGVSEAEAYQQTLLELSSSEFLRHELWHSERTTNPEPIILGTNRSTNMITDLWQDLRYGLRTSSKSARLFASVREAVQKLDEQAAVSVRTMEDVLSRANWTPRNLALRLAALSAVVLLLAAMDIYGVASYVVAQRTCEMGIRLALGARRRDILKLVLGQGVKLTLAGIVIGLALSLGPARFLTTQLFGVSAYDPSTFTAITSLLLGVALLASYRPAWRASKVCLIIALKYE